MRLTLVVLALAFFAGSAAASEPPTPEIPSADPLLQGVDLALRSTSDALDETFRGVDAGVRATDRAREEVSRPPPPPPEDAEDREESASHDARDEAPPDDLALRSDPVPFVASSLPPLVDEVARPVVRTVPLLERLTMLLSEAARLVVPDAALAPEPVRRAGAASAEVASAAGAAASAVAASSAPGAAILLGGAVTVLPGSPQASAWWRRLLFGLAGYSRLARARLLDQEARNAIHAAVRDHPGISTPKVAEAARVGRTTATYHLRVLEREGYLTSRLIGRARRYFSVGERRELGPDALALLQHPTTGALAREVARDPGVDQSTLCDRLRLSPSLAHWHLERLEKAGLVAKERDGRRVRYAPSGAPRGI